jgi:hypothetical protein
MLLGPSASGFALTAWLDARAGLRDMWQRLTHWRVGWGWAAVALLTVPLPVLTILWPSSAWVDPAFAPGFNLAVPKPAMSCWFRPDCGCVAGMAVPGDRRAEA